LTSETVKCVALAAIVAREAPGRRALALARAPATWRGDELMQVFRLNRDLFGRTALLMAATVLLTRAGARQGAVILAANAILYQLFMLSALLLDGFESAAQVLCGEALGAGDRPGFDRAVRTSLILAAAAAVLVTLIYGIGGPALAASFSTAPAVVAATRAFLPWAVAMPLAGVASFVFDGVFIGAGWTRAMLITMAGALAVFVVALAAARPLGNAGLWLAFCLFLTARAVGQAWLAPGLARRAFAPGPA
jgi:MATE family multidrug resistance protein